jgi:hypothetical protein
MSSSSITRRLDRIERQIAPTGGIDPALLADVAQTLERIRRQDEAILARYPDLANGWHDLEAQHATYVRARYGDITRFTIAEWVAISDRDPTCNEFNHACSDCLAEAQTRRYQTQGR